MFLLDFFDESHHGIDDVLIDDVLDVVFGPVEGEEAHALDDWTVGGMPACAIYYMCDLVESEPFDVLNGAKGTCAMTSSLMKMQSVILVGMESSSWGGELVVDCCMV